VLCRFQASISEQAFAKELEAEYPDVRFIACHADYDKAAEKADIIVTAVSCRHRC
jgi:ornithine cyclodeaminase/alanine dehydrogenase